MLACEECDDAPTTTKAWFNGRTLIGLCDECAAWWENHGLIEPRIEDDENPTTDGGGYPPDHPAVGLIEFISDELGWVRREVDGHPSYIRCNGCDLPVSRVRHSMCEDCILDADGEGE